MKGMVGALVLCALFSDAAAAPAAAPPQLSAAAQQAKEVGFQDCAAALDGFVRFVHGDAEHYGFYGFWSKDHPNDETFSTLTSETYADGKGLTSFTAVKTRSGKCDVSATQVFILADTICANARDGAFKDWKEHASLNGDKIYQDPTSANVTALLTPVGQTGCVVVKRLIAVGLDPTQPFKKD